MPQLDHEDLLRTHRQLAALLGASEQGRDHFDAISVIAAIKRAFRITHIEISPYAEEVRITTADGVVHVMPIGNKEVF